MTKINVDFQYRKIQKIRFSFYTTLPLDWVTNMNLGKGDILKIRTHGDQLMITPVSGNSHEPQKLEANTPIVKEEMRQHGRYVS